MKMKSHNGKSKGKHIKSNKNHKNNKLQNRVSKNYETSKVNKQVQRDKTICDNITSTEISRVFNEYKNKTDKSNELLIKNCILIYPNQLINIHKLRKIILPQTYVILYEDPFFFNKQVNNNKYLFHKLSFNYYYKKLEKIYRSTVKYITSDVNIATELVKYKTIYTYYQPELHLVHRLFKICYNNNIKIVSIDSPSYLVNNVVISKLVNDSYINSYKNITYSELVKFITDEYDLPDYDLITKRLNIDEPIKEIDYKISESIKYNDKISSNIIVDSNLIDLHKVVKIKYSTVDDKHIREIYNNQSIEYDNKFYLPFTHTHAIDMFKKFLYNYLIKEEVSVTKFFNKKTINEDIDKVKLTKNHLYESFIYMIKFSLDNCLLLPEYIINKTIRVYNARAYEFKNKTLILFNIIKFIKLIICEREYINTKNEYRFINFYDKFNSSERDIRFDRLDIEYSIYIELIEYTYNITFNNKEIIYKDKSIDIYNSIINNLNNSGFITDSNLLLCTSYLSLQSANKQTIVKLLSKSITFSVLQDKWIFSNNYLLDNKQIIDQLSYRYMVNKIKYNSNIFIKYITNKPFIIGELNKYKLVMSFDQLINNYICFIDVSNNELQDNSLINNSLLNDNHKIDYNNFSNIKYNNLITIKNKNDYKIENNINTKDNKIDECNSISNHNFDTLTITINKTNNMNNFLLIWFILYYEFIRNNVNDTYMNKYSLQNFLKYNKLKFTTKSTMIKLANNTKFLLSY